MKPRFIKLTPDLYQSLQNLLKRADEDKRFRLVRRVRTILLSHEGFTSCQIAFQLSYPLSRVSEWIRRYEAEGVEGLIERGRTGRPSFLTDKQKNKLKTILSKGPQENGYLCPAWNLDNFSQTIEDKFQLAYHPRHVRKLLLKHALS
ncbi:helix-turn-helix domain-containing protein [bacterium]|nr:helix-turn-helix domain-containing protein [bacterium]